MINARQNRAINYIVSDVRESGVDRYDAAPEIKYEIIKYLEKANDITEDQAEGARFHDKRNELVDELMGEAMDLFDQSEAA